MTALHLSLLCGQIERCSLTVVIGPVGTCQHSAPHLSTPPSSAAFSISYSYIWKRLNSLLVRALVRLLELGVTCVRSVTPASFLLQQPRNEGSIAFAASSLFSGLCFTRPNFTIYYVTFYFSAVRAHYDPAVINYVETVNYACI